MSFRARNAILDDDEEWFNIPAVVRSFLRQLNNELQSNRLTCDTLLQNHQEHDTLLKGVVSKQMEREFETTKAVLTLQQDYQEVQASLSDMVESVREQMRHVCDEQQHTRESIRRFEDKEHEAIVMRDTLRSQLNGISKNMNTRLLELENMLHTRVDELANSVEEVRKETWSVREKNSGLGIETRKEFERLNITLQQLGNAMSEEADNLRLQIQQHENFFAELREFHAETGRRSGKYEKKQLRLQEKVNETATLVKQMESSFDVRFQSVYRTLEKLQVLYDRLVAVQHQGNGDQSSLLAVLKEGRDTHKALIEELKKSFEEQSKSNRRELDLLNKRVSDLHQLKPEVVSLIGEKNESLIIRLEDVCRKVDVLESTVPKSNFVIAIEDKVNNRLESVQSTYEGRILELHHSLLQQRDALQGEIEHIKSIIGDLDKKREKSRNTTRRVEGIEETLRDFAGQVRRYEKILDGVQGKMNALNDAVSSLQAVVPTIDCSNNKKDINSGGLAGDIDVTRFVTSEDLGEVRAAVERVQDCLGTHENQLMETRQGLLRYESLVNEIPKTYQRYIESVDQKLSPALLELDLLRSRLASFEHQRVDSEARKMQKHFLSNNAEDNELEGMRLGIQQNRILQSVQRHQQTMEVRLDSFQNLIQVVENRVDLLSREVSDISQTTAALGEQKEHNVFVKNELKRIFTQLQNFEVEMRALEKSSASKLATIQASVTDLRTMESSLDVISDEIKLLEGALKNCVTVTSVEWVKVSEMVSTLSRGAQEGSLHNASKESNIFNNSDQAFGTDSASAWLRSEQEKLRHCLEQVQGQMEEKVHLDVFKQTKDGFNKLLTMLEERVMHLEGDICNNLSHIPPVVSDALASFANRVQGLETAVDEIKIDKHLTAQCSPQQKLASSSTSSLLPVVSVGCVSDEVTALAARLKELEGAIAALRGAVGGEEGGQIWAVSVLTNRLAILEGTVATCMREMADFSKVLSVFQERIGHVEERLPGDDKEPSSLIVMAPQQESMLTDSTTRLERLEFTVKQVEENLNAFKGAANTSYTKSQLDGRFENLWASFIVLLARKEDQETVDHKLTELRREVMDSALQMGTALRELKRVVEDCVSITEVRELLEGTKEKK